MAYIIPCSKFHHFCGLFKLLLFVLYRIAERTGVNHAAKVFVQRFPKFIHIHLLDSLNPITFEFDLRGA